MTANRDLILAGLNGGGAAGTALANFAPIGTTMPISATATLNVAFKDPGLCVEDGLKKLLAEEVTKIKAYGTRQTVRTLKTSREATFEIGFLESNPVSLAIANELPLTGTGALVPDEDGAFDFTEGESRTQLYAGVFDIVDGANHIRAVCPLLEKTGQKDWEAKGTAPIQHGVTLTAYPGSDGVAIHWFYVLAALATP